MAQKLRSSLKYAPLREIALFYTYSNYKFIIFEEHMKVISIYHPFNRFLGLGKHCTDYSVSSRSCKTISQLSRSRLGLGKTILKNSRSRLDLEILSNSGLGLVSNLENYEEKKRMENTKNCNK